jgi:hypothetical protein
VISDNAHTDLGRLFEMLADALDVPPEIDSALKEKYEQLASWVRFENEDRMRTDSEIYPQGSRNIGTMISPLRAGQDYDCDIVYVRHLLRASVSQRELKQQVGEQLVRFLRWLEMSALEAPQLKEGSRCWTLRWAHRFHIDILPALPGDAANNRHFGEHHLWITDRELRYWQSSNPKGFAAWFKSRAELALQKAVDERALASKVEIEPIPQDSVKSPLQRLVQLLKRHRDLFYEGDPDDRPSSIIVTTLAAKAYNSELTVYDALRLVVPRMRNHVVLRAGVHWVANPTNHEENFADRWATDPTRAVRFFDWLTRVEEDLGAVHNARALDRVTDAASRGWGIEPARTAARKLGDALRAQRASGKLRMSTETGALGTVGSVAVPAHTFFGRKA